MKKQKESATKTIQERFHNLNTRRTALLNAYVQIYEEYKQLQTQVLEKELLTWQREQQMAGNGYNMNDSRSIEVIQEWCEGLADIIWSLKQQVKQLQTLRDKIQDPQNPDAKPNLLMEITTLLYNLVKSTFIIEKQPPQVCGLSFYIN